jgi:hypothetical protein
MKRRDIMLSLSGLSAVSLAGCADLVAGDGIELESEPAGLSESVLDSSGYTLQEYKRTEVDEEIKVSNFTRKLYIRIDTATYTPETELPAGMTFVTSGSETIAGTEVNPLYNMDGEDIIRLIEPRVDAIQNSEKVNEFTREHQTGTELTIDEFESETTIAGQTVTIKVYTTVTKINDAIILILGYHIKDDIPNEEAIKNNFTRFIHPAPELQNTNPKEYESKQKEEELI